MAERDVLVVELKALLQVSCFRFWFRDSETGLKLRVSGSRVEGRFGTRRVWKAKSTCLRPRIASRMHFHCVDTTDSTEMSCECVCVCERERESECV